MKLKPVIDQLNYFHGYDENGNEKTWVISDKIARMFNRGECNWSPLRSSKSACWILLCEITLTSDIGASGSDDLPYEVNLSILEWIRHRYDSN